MCVELPQVRRRSRRVRPFGAQDATFVQRVVDGGPPSRASLKTLPTGEYEQIVEVPIVKTAQLHMRCVNKPPLGLRGVDVETPSFVGSCQ
ncbi:UNVERIFIED_CONTAM: hypothetical protein Slati_2712000 [Sesamum latifolium]|uniref:Uncharacterized protein n=1 Tax=Sesamum latifolium TaxID=2727402 RepID=A0AAW2VWM4_9LAMI